MFSNMRKGRPALEGIGRLLITKFGPRVRNNRIKQMLGERAAQLMEEMGFTRNRKARVQGDPVFKNAKRFK
jgi:hypothetical protein